jgi:hypothetical protein
MNYINGPTGLPLWSSQGYQSQVSLLPLTHANNLLLLYYRMMGNLPGSP